MKTRKGIFWDCNKEVMRYLGNVKVSRSLVSMVRSGKRKNDAIMQAIIEVDKLIHTNQWTS